MPRLAKVVNVLAIRQVRQGTETTGFRVGFSLRSCQYVSSSQLYLLFTAISSLHSYIFSSQLYPIVFYGINRTFGTELWSELCASPG